MRSELELARLDLSLPSDARERSLAFEAAIQRRSRRDSHRRRLSLTPGWTRVHRSMSDALLKRVLEPPPYGWSRNGEFYKPSTREIMAFWVTRVNPFRTRKNW